MNPYETLGLSKDATDDEVRKAYRDKAKTAHPDAGGDPEEFRKIATAVAVLKDPARRKRYDETGTVDEATPQHPDKEAMRIVSDMLQAVLDPDPKGEGLNIPDIASIDLVDVMCQQLDATIEPSKRKLAKIARTRTRAERAHKRFKRKSKGANLMQSALQHHIALLDRMREHTQAQLDPYLRAREIVMDYSFDVEKAPAMSGFARPDRPLSAMDLDMLANSWGRR